MPEELLKKLIQELEIRNFSKKTINSYYNQVSKFLIFAEKRELKLIPRFSA